MSMSVIYLPVMKDWTPSKIQQLRKAVGITQAQLAVWLGVTKMHVSHLEQGRRPAGPQTVRLLGILAERVKSGKGKTVQPQRKRGKT